MKKAVVLTTAIFFAAFAYPAMAQVMFQPDKVVGPAPGHAAPLETKTDQPKAYEPASQPQHQQQPTASQAKETQSAANSCKMISIAIPGLPHEQPQMYSVLFLDDQPGFVQALTSCNPNAQVGQYKSYRSAYIKVTQGVNQKAYLQIPSNRAQRLKCRFHTSSPKWPLKNRYWNCDGTIGDRVALELQPVDPPKGN